MKSKMIRNLIALNSTPACLSAAIEAFCKYLRRKERSEHPEGFFDRADRFYPSTDEDCGVMRSIRSPSRSWPFSYMLACRTLAHCETLCDADHDAVLLVRRFLKLKTAYFTNPVNCRAFIDEFLRQEMDINNSAK